MKPGFRPTEELSPRQREILRLVAAGYGDKEIADLVRPRISLRTVHSHLDVIYQRLRARNRAHAVFLFYFKP